MTLTSHSQRVARAMEVSAPPSIDAVVEHLYRSGLPVIEVRGPDGRAMAFVVRPEFLPVELKPSEGRVPRRLRPKQRLSKRQRDAAKRERLRPEAPVVVEG